LFWANNTPEKATNNVNNPVLNGLKDFIVDVFEFLELNNLK
jgi:hypothetical protein